MELGWIKSTTCLKTAQHDQEKKYSFDQLACSKSKSCRYLVKSSEAETENKHTFVEFGGKARQARECIKLSL